MGRRNIAEAGQHGEDLLAGKDGPNRSVGVPRWGFDIRVGVSVDADFFEERVRIVDRLALALGSASTSASSASASALLSPPRASPVSRSRAVIEPR
jgi:hypothetical protein